MLPKINPAEILLPATSPLLCDSKNVAALTGGDECAVRSGCRSAVPGDVEIKPAELVPGLAIIRAEQHGPDPADERLATRE